MNFMAAVTIHSECKGRKSRNTGVIGEFGLGVQNEAEQRLTEFCQENTLVIAKLC